MTLKEWFLIAKIVGIVGIIAAFVVCDIIIQVQHSRLEEAQKSIKNLNDKVARLEYVYNLESELLQQRQQLQQKAASQNEQVQTVIEANTDWSQSLLPSDICQLWNSSEETSYYAPAIFNGTL